MARLDPHSYNDSTQPEINHVGLRARVDFPARVVHAEAELTLRSVGEGPLDLDTRRLDILAVTVGERALSYRLEAEEPILGSRLRVELPAGTRSLRIRYRTSPTASALQWLEPAQTAGRVQPFLFSQCQAIHARSLLPLQDTPRVRIRYRAELAVPRALKALMAAAFVGRVEEGDQAVETWEMRQSIPPYLFAFAVGDLVSRELGPRSRVWAEPEVVDKAAWEFAGVNAMLRTAEKLFGPYDWERFDLLTMPPSFPYGGMENPRLTFLTPTLVAGDRSLVAVVAHELAHSWTGNLVSNASAEHFWLNEGFTVFAERRIVEAIEGKEAAELSAALGRRELDEAVQRFSAQPELTRLRTELTGVDPDEAFSEIPYEKGYLFLRTIEDAAGKAAFTDFLRAYVDRFRFRAITTDDFVALADELLPGVLAQVDAPAWIDGAGVPSLAPTPRSTRLSALEQLGSAAPSDEQARAFSPTEWQLYLEALPHPSPPERLRALEARFSLTARDNYEVLVSWLVLAIDSGIEEVRPRAAEVLARVGRMKYLRPLYLALHRRDAAEARRIYAERKQGYHPIACQVIEGILGAAAAA